jgi:flagellar M-ring protein FliF
MAIATTPPENTITPETGISESGDQNRTQTDEVKNKRPKSTISNLAASPIGEGLSVESFKFDNLKNTIQQMVAQPAVKKTLPALIVFFILLIFVSIFAQGEFFKPTTYRLLLPGLNEPEKQMALETLNEGGYDAKVDKKTGHLMVVEKAYHEARMYLASKGIPKAPVPTGIETLKEQSSMTTSQFMEQVNYVSALEQDLGRSISAMATVNSARVHLALPKQSVFVRDRTPPKASVVVSPIPNRIVTATQVDAIVHLIASSVPYLDPTHVSIVDNFGNLLTRKNDSAAGLSSTQMSHKQDIEQTYRSRILEILTPVFGEGNVQAQVDVSMNFRQTEITSEDFDRNGAGPKTRSETLAEDRTNKLDAQGVPGALTNAPPRPNELTDSTGALPDDFGQESVTLSKRATRNYEIDRIVKHVKEQVGLVERVSVAVVVNEKRTHPDFDRASNNQNQSNINDEKPNSKSLIAGYSQPEIDRLTNLVRGVVGYKETRGDVVTLMPTAFYEDPPEPWFKNPVTIDALKTAIASLVFLLFLLTIVKPIMTSMFAPPQAEEVVVDEEEEKDKEGIAMAHVAIEMAASEPAIEGLEMAAIDMASNEMALEGPEVALGKIHESEGGLLTNDMIAAAQDAQQKAQAAAVEQTEAEGEDEPEEGFIDLDEGESLEEIKAKLKPKKASISMDMLDTANSYDDKVVLMRLLVQEDEGRVAAVLRNMMKSA